MGFGFSDVPPIRGFNCGHILAKDRLLRRIEIALEEEHAAHLMDREKRPSLPPSLPGSRVIAALERAGVHCIMCKIYLTRQIDPYTQPRNMGPQGATRYVDSRDISVAEDEEAAREYLAR